MDPRIETDGDESVQLGGGYLVFSQSEEASFFGDKGKVVCAAGTRIAHKLVLLVQPDCFFYVQRRLAHGQCPAVAPVSDEVDLMDSPASRPLGSKPRVQIILELVR